MGNAEVDFILDINNEIMPFEIKYSLFKFPEIIALVPFIGISIQNAYMYSTMNSVELHNHTFAYIALFIGAGMFVLWKTYFSILVVLISLISNILLFSINKKFLPSDYTHLVFTILISCESVQ